MLIRTFIRLLVVAAALALAACSNPAGSSAPASPRYAQVLYLTDTLNGRVYTFDPQTQKTAALPLVTTAPSAGEIRFYRGIGYVAVGSKAGAGVYTFDPSVPVPQAVLLPGSEGLNAQYFAFVSPTQAYFSVAGDYAGNQGALFRFNPSDLTVKAVRTAETTVTAYLQEVAVGPDGQVYAAANLSQRVYRIDPKTGTTAVILARKPGTTGLQAGIYRGKPGIFVANTGSFTPPGGSIDFIPVDAADGSTATLVTDQASPVRLLALANGNLVASGWSNTWLVDLSKAPASVTEIKAGQNSFGSSSLVQAGTRIAVASRDWTAGTNSLHFLDAAGAWLSSAAVMTASDGVSNAAVFQ